MQVLPAASISDLVKRYGDMIVFKYVEKKRNIRREFSDSCFV